MRSEAIKCCEFQSIAEHGKCVVKAPQTQQGVVALNRWSEIGESFDPLPFWGRHWLKVRFEVGQDGSPGPCRCAFPDHAAHNRMSVVPVGLAVPADQAAILQ